MAAIPLLGGRRATEQAEFVESPPINLEPVALDNKIAKGQFRAPHGAVGTALGPGVDRGGMCWNGRHLRVMGTKLVQVSMGRVTTLGDVGGSGPVSMDYGFDRLGIRSDRKLFYWDGQALTQVVDVDLGPVNDLIWVDGYFMTTDGTSLVVTELSDPTSVKPLKYGSAEEDPDPITGLMKFRGEVYALGRHTVQVYQNVGGNGFPFQQVRGATIPFGCVSASAKCLFAESFAFVGGGRNEALGVFVAGQGTAIRISTRAVDRALAAATDPAMIECESRTYLGERRLLIHLPDETWCYLFEASRELGEALWFRQRSGVDRPYRLRHAVECDGALVVGDTETGWLGDLTGDVSAHFGEPVEWRFDTGFAHGDGTGFIVHSVELVGLPGRTPDTARAFLSVSRDGETWSAEKAIDLGGRGERRKRMQWRPHWRCPNYAALRFRGYDHAMPGFTKIMADVEPLSA